MSPIEIYRIYSGKKEIISTLNSGEKNVRSLSFNTTLESIGLESGGTIIINSPVLRITGNLTSGSEIDIKSFALIIRATDQTIPPSHQTPETETTPLAPET